MVRQLRIGHSASHVTQRRHINIGIFIVAALHPGITRHTGRKRPRARAGGRVALCGIPEISWYRDVPLMDWRSIRATRTTASTTVSEPRAVVGDLAVCPPKRSRTLVHGSRTNIA